VLDLNLIIKVKNYLGKNTEVRVDDT